MGAAASTEDAVGIAFAAVGDRVTRDGCRQLSNLLKWSGDVEEFIGFAFDDDDVTISKEKVLKKVTKAARKNDAKQKKKDVLKNKGEATYIAALSQQGVDGLSALPTDVRTCFVPVDSDEVGAPAPAGRCRLHRLVLLPAAATAPHAVCAGLRALPTWR
jgi:hypothetical protein